MLQLLGETAEKIPLQKLLFLFTRRQTIPAYDFVPYKYGCFSFSSNADLTVMARKGMIQETEKSFSKTDRTDYLKQLQPHDAHVLREIVIQYGRMSADELMHSTYVQYPYYATRSETAQRILSKHDFQKVRSAIPQSHETILFTIGYEGISLEEYLNRLIRNDIKVLIDVRNNPLSMKYGFSKSQLLRYCSSLHIEYVHLPEVGIRSEQRRELNVQSDYDQLFEVYRSENLPATIETQKKIMELLRQHHRIALTCFEANIRQCHRMHLAEAVAALPGFTYELQHI